MLNRIRNKLHLWQKHLKPKSPLEKELLDDMVNYKGRALNRFPADCTLEEQHILEMAGTYSMTSVDRMLGLLRSIDYIYQNNIPGDFVECGVWRGGSMMAVALKLQQINDNTRHLYLFDTFEGMTMPHERDKRYDGQAASLFLRANSSGEREGAYWCIASLDDVMHTMQLANYPKELINYVKGKVEDTLPYPKIKEIALLRLDTDWYHSTHHELVHLYDKVVPGGVVIIDDYGHWQGAKDAVDEFFDALDYKPFLHRLDYTGRLLIKPMQ